MEKLLAEAKDDEVHGRLNGAYEKALHGYQQTSPHDPWHVPFQVELADVELYRGQIREACDLLSLPLPDDVSVSLKVKYLALYAVALSSNAQNEDAERAMHAAEALAAQASDAMELDSAWGFLKSEENDFQAAEARYTLCLRLAEDLHDELMQMKTLVNLGVIEMQMEHFEEALEYDGRAIVPAKHLGSQSAQEKLVGNEGYAYLKLGDFPHAEENFRKAQKLAEAAGAPSDEILWKSNEGLAKFRKGEFAGAELLYKECLERATAAGDPKLMSDAQLALGTLWLDSNPAAAKPLLATAAETYRARGNDQDLQGALLEQAVFEVHHGDPRVALPALLALDEDPRSPPSLRWQVEQEVARLWVKLHEDALADRWFRSAVTTFEQQSRTVDQTQFGLPFQENGTEIYRVYVEHLIAEKKTDEALAVLDESRGKELLSGLEQGRGVLRAATISRTAQRFAERVHGTILVYCLMPEVSYLWAISKGHTGFYRLPGEATIGTLVKRQRALLKGDSDPLYGYEAGQTLYDILIRPAAAQIQPGDSVYVLADRTLNELNFDTLLTRGEHPHFWIEDVAITNAASLRLLTAEMAPAPRMGGGRLLLIGDPTYPPDKQLSKLPQAHDEVEKVATHFDRAQETILTGNAATSASYEEGDPNRYTYIHFVAHAEASELDPMESFIWLSGTTDKLYVRNIIRHPLQAELVTLSTCFSSGTRVYSGEGLVGLAWAFQRAGARSVIGALWEVSDGSAPTIMDHLYANLALGMPPDQALRDAKLTALHTPGIFRKPFYWAPFQLYSNSAGVPVH